MTSSNLSTLVGATDQSTPKQGLEIVLLLHYSIHFVWRTDCKKAAEHNATTTMLDSLHSLKVSPLFLNTHLSHFFDCQPFQSIFCPYSDFHQVGYFFSLPRVLEIIKYSWQYIISINSHILEQVNV